MSFERRYSMPFESGMEGSAVIDYGAIIDRTVILSPSGGVKIGAARLEQCVVVEPCEIADNVVARGAILQGKIGFGCEIDSNADVQGTLDAYVRAHRDARVRPGALIGERAELLDRCIIEEDAEVGANAVIGVEAVVRERAFVAAGSRVPRRAQIPIGGYWDPTDARQQYSDLVPIRIVEEDEFEKGDRWDDPGPQEFEDPDVPWGKEMVRGHAQKELEDFNPGTSRSWALTKLARIAALEGPMGRISKKLIREHRPDLLDHPVTKEVLRIQPPMTALQLNDESWQALSPTHYDLYTGVKFHSGAEPEWQMIGPKPNDVFVLGVPDRVISEVASESGAEMYSLKRELFEKVEWHPDQEVEFPIGWVRTLLYPRVLLAIIEVQSDRPWMKFGWSRHTEPFRPVDELREEDWEERQETTESLDRAAKMLRDMYFKTFAADAINMVVEWAFSNRYQEVFILDQKSRRQLGGKPPKDYYDTIPKRYTKLAPSMLPGWVKTYDWVPRAKIKGRIIRPNRGW